jgi:glycosyltransferase A (GT-A) superfamily protein (DUF2064 family)
MDSPNGHEDALLVLLCRPPDSPDSKTRLAADLGRERARLLYERCLESVLTSAASVEADLRVAVAGRPLDLADWCLRHAPRAELVRQRGMTFAQRQRNELRRGLADGYARVAFMASDLPVIDPEHIAWALHGHAEDVRVVPAHDGGYCVLGTNTDLPELTDVPMSRGDTRTLLVEALRHNGKTVAEADFTVVNLNRGSDLAAIGRDVGGWS